MGDMSVLKIGGLLDGILNMFIFLLEYYLLIKIKSIFALQFRNV